MREFVSTAADQLGMHISWKGTGIDEVGTVASLASEHSPHVIVRVDPRYFRPTEVETLLGNPSKAKKKLGWAPKTSFEELVSEMVREDLKSAERDELVKKHGFVAYDYHE